MIPVEEYKKIIGAIPILCVDLVLRDRAGRYLLVKRENEPLRGEWWVVGGRVLKGERAEAAARRKLEEEIGLTVPRLELLGLYEDFFDRNSLGIETLYHTVSIVFGGTLDDVSGIRLDAQHKEWKLAEQLPERLRIQAFRGIDP
ncbi:MAG: NUDIX domain-containing protein [Pseudomonadota bacterium]|nr:MAG: hypothetical protein DIU78_12560 [Pseudomonadota bacterium]